MDVCRALFTSSTSPENENVEFVSKMFQTKLVISFEASSSPVQTVGEPSWKQALLSNAPVVDGAGNAAAHFRYIWAPFDSAALEKPTCERKQKDPVGQAIFCPWLFEHFCI